MSNKFSRRGLLGGAAAVGLTAPFIRRAAAAGPGITLGCLTDLSGPYADLTGAGSVGSIRLAMEDFAKIHPEIPVTLKIAEFGLKPDVGLSILRGWLDNDGVDAALDFPMSALALAAGKVFEDKNKVGLITSAATSDLTRNGCGPNHIQFASDSFALAAAMVKTIVAEGGDSWFFILPDYELGKSMVADASRAVSEAGGKILGTVAYAFPGTTDFGSYLLQAQASGAKVLCLANAGSESVNSIKQAREFGILAKGMKLAVPFMGEPAIHALGLHAAQGIYFASPFYWERDAGSRAFSDRLVAIVPNQRPNKNFANAYSGALHYLKTAAAIGVATAKADGRATVAAMKAMPMNDSVMGKAVIRLDGMTLRDMLLLKIKTPAESKQAWDYCTIVGTSPAALVSRPMNEGGCKLVKV